MSSSGKFHFLGLRLLWSAAGLLPPLPAFLGQLLYSPIGFSLSSFGIFVFAGAYTSVGLLTSVLHGEAQFAWGSHFLGG